jgi:hypothetical protein
VTTVQLRTYRLPTDVSEQDAWLDWWVDVRAMRERHGFRIVSAVLDRATGELNWLVEHDADFVAAEQAMAGSAERDELFARPHPHIEIIRTDFVDSVI